MSGTRSTRDLVQLDFALIFGFWIFKNCCLCQSLQKPQGQLPGLTWHHCFWALTAEIVISNVSSSCRYSEHLAFTLLSWADFHTVASGFLCYTVATSVLTSLELCRIPIPVMPSSKVGLLWFSRPLKHFNSISFKDLSFSHPSLSDFSHWLYSSLCTPSFGFFGLNYPQIWWVWNTNNMKVPQGFQFNPASLGASAHICIHVWGFYMRMSLGDLLLDESLTLLIYQLGECSQQPPGHSTLKTGSHH